MQSRSPVLNRIDKEAAQGNGFAYDEGRSAYQRAASGQMTMDAAQAAGVGGGCTGPRRTGGHDRGCHRQDGHQLSS